MRLFFTYDQPKFAIEYYGGLEYPPSYPASHSRSPSAIRLDEAALHFVSELSYKAIRQQISNSEFPKVPQHGERYAPTLISPTIPKLVAIPQNLLLRCTTSVKPTTLPDPHPRCHCQPPCRQRCGATTHRTSNISRRRPNHTCNTTNTAPPRSITICGVPFLVVRCNWSIVG
jgi:hypothetical protein